MFLLASLVYHVTILGIQDLTVDQRGYSFSVSATRYLPCNTFPEVRGLLRCKPACRFDPKKGGKTMCFLYVVVCGYLLCCVTRNTHKFIYEGVNCLNSVSNRCYTYAQINAIGSIRQLSDCSCMFV